MFGGWTFGKSWTRINFFISHQLGATFLKFVDASNEVKDAKLLFDLSDDVVTEVGWRM
jgi:hypothetical protein